MSHSIRFLFAVAALALTVELPAAPDRSDLPSIEEATRSTRAMDGFFSIYRDERQGRLLLEIDRFDTEFLYVTSLPQGLGSNDVGLDRGQLSGGRIVYFHRVGPRVLLVQPNMKYRADGDHGPEERAVDQSFARSVLWGFEVMAESGGRVLVDATEFFLRDAHGVVERLKTTGQGTYSPDASRSAIFPPRTKAFPDNTEVEAVVTFTGTPEGEEVRSVAPNPEAVTLHQHHSFVRLPEKSGFEPLALDPRSGFLAGRYGLRYRDYSVPIGEQTMQQLALRHRLERKDAGGVAEPITYYVDPAAPEPVRTALMEGAEWWAEAFEAAGMENAFRVRVLPEGADPMDIRYNVIQWVHRSTRGWSYGSSVFDPRTGEILKGHVTLGSLRVRQDYLLAEGFLAPYDDGVPESDPMREMALARLRQLAAHEVGHTLGLAHNFAASAHDRASVMDYPHPLVRLDDEGGIDLSDAYDRGIGAWDKVAIRWGYGDYAGADDPVAARRSVLEEAFEAGQEYISDADARPDGGAHPRAHLWDNGDDPVAELDRLMAVRGRVLERFGKAVLRDGQPLARMEEVLVPMYLMHRYQVTAAAKVLGGVDYRYALKGAGPGRGPDVVDGAWQRRALESLLDTLAPARLVVPADVVSKLPPRPPGYGRNRELFSRNTGVTFDPAAAAESAAQHTVQLLLHPERAARLIQQHAADPGVPGFSETVDRLMAATWYAQPVEGRRGVVQRVAENVVLDQLLRLASDDSAAPGVRSVALAAVDALHARLVRRAGERSAGAPSTPFGGAAARGHRSSAERAHARFAIHRIERFRKLVPERPVHEPVEIPPGSPIGAIDRR